MAHFPGLAPFLPVSFHPQLLEMFCGILELPGGECEHTLEIEQFGWQRGIALQQIVRDIELPLVKRGARRITQQRKIGRIAVQKTEQAL